MRQAIRVTSVQAPGRPNLHLVSWQISYPPHIGDFSSDLESNAQTPANRSTTGPSCTYIYLDNELRDHNLF